MSEIEKQEILKHLPGLEWDEERINITSFLDLIGKKYPQFKFQFKECFNNPKLDVIEVFGLFESDRKIDFAIGYNSLLPPTFCLLDKVVNKRLRIIEGYKILIDGNKIEVGFKLGKKLEEFDGFSGSGLEIKTEFESKEINLIVTRQSLDYHVIFGQFNSYSVLFENVFGDDNSLLSFISKLENSFTYHLYDSFSCKASFHNYDYDITLESLIFLKQNRVDKDKFHFKTLVADDETKILINYLSAATAIDYLPFKFLTYYHILEFFFEDSFIKEMVSLSTSIIDQKTLDKFINSVNDCKQEIRKLELVLKKYISLKEFEDNFVDVNKEVPEIISYYKVKLPQVNLTDLEFYGNLAKRIYTLRNSIVHSKSNSKSGESLKYSENDYIFLYNEIFLIRWIAETIVRKTIC